MSILFTVSVLYVLLLKQNSIQKLTRSNIYSVLTHTINKQNGYECYPYPLSLYISI